MRRVVVLVCVCLVALACYEEESGLERFENLDFEGSNQIVDDSCIVESTKLLSWTKETSLGSPAEVFSVFAGQCEAQLVWDGSELTDVVDVVPLKGTSSIRATFELDKESARLSKLETERKVMCFCPPNELAINATLTLETGDTILAQDLLLKLSKRRNDNFIDAVFFGFDIGKLEPLFSITPTSPDVALSAHFQVDAIGAGCQGRLTLGYQKTGESGQSVELTSWREP